MSERCGREMYHNYRDVWDCALPKGHDGVCNVQLRPKAEPRGAEGLAEALRALAEWVPGDGEHRQTLRCADAAERLEKRLDALEERDRSHKCGEEWHHRQIGEIERRVGTLEERHDALVMAAKLEEHAPPASAPKGEMRRWVCSHCDMAWYDEADVRKHAKEEAFRLCAGALYYVAVLGESKYVPDPDEEAP